MTQGGFILAYDPKSIVTLGNSLICRDFANFLRRPVKTLRLTAVKFLGYLFHRNFMKNYINTH